MMNMSNCILNLQGSYSVIDIQNFWAAVLKQDADAIREYFAPDAWINWHNTNEHFTVNEFLRANCEYPGAWIGQVETEIHVDDTIITATHVETKDNSLSFHVTSFIQVKDGKIVAIDEYWGDDGEAPSWRKNMNIGRKIK